MDRLLHEVPHALEFLLKARDEIMRPVFEQDNEAEGEKDKQQKPEKSAQQSHGRRLIDQFQAVNAPAPSL